MKRRAHHPLEEEGAFWMSCTHHEISNQHTEKKRRVDNSKVRVLRNERFRVDQLNIVLLFI